MLEIISVHFYFYFGVLADSKNLCANWIMTKLTKKKEPLIERMTLPLTPTQFQRYKRLSNELEKRNLEKLHDLTRERINRLLDEVEQELSA